MSENNENSEEMESIQSEEVLITDNVPRNAESPVVAEQAETEKVERLTRLPLARIRTLIKADQDVSIASLESVFLITKATELFIENLAKEMHRITQGQKRKTIYKKDMDSIVEMMDEYAFLEGTLD